MKSLALALMLVSCIAGCTTTVRREGEVLFMYCMLACVLRIDDAQTDIQSNVRKALPSARPSTPSE